MAIDSTPAGMQSVTQLGWQQFKLQQAKRTADQAEQTAQVLQQQAAAAKDTAARAQQDARTLAVQADQAQTYAVRTRQGLAALSSQDSMQNRLSYVINQAAQRQAAIPSTLPVPAKSAPVVNSQGQTTGRIINTTA